MEIFVMILGHYYEEFQGWQTLQTFIIKWKMKILGLSLKKWKEHIQIFPIRESCNSFLKLCNTIQGKVDHLCSVKIYSQLKYLKMKKLIFVIATAFMLLTFIPSQVKAEKDSCSTTLVEPKNLELAEANALITRLNEINEMDMSNLSSPEKRELRSEVRTIKSELNELGGGIYISVGAVIIILLILIILF